MQLFFINGRPVRSKTVMAALEEAFRSYLPHGKYPGAVLFVELPLGLTDVNVHPAKLEIKFADERPVFSAVYYAVRNRLTASTQPAEQPEEAVSPSAAPENVPKRTAEPANPAKSTKTAGPREPFPKPSLFSASAPKKNDEPKGFRADIGLEDLQMGTPLRVAQPEEPTGGEQPDAPAQGTLLPEDPQQKMDDRPYHKLIGEAYDAFLFVETADEVLVIDKHAAHERILYEQLASRKQVRSQGLLTGIPLTLPPGDAAVLCENAPYLAEFGFEVEPFGGDTVLVRAVPASLAGTKELRTLLEGFASELTDGSRVSFEEKCDRALFTVACKAALKAGIPNDPAHNEWIVEQLLENPSLRYCPHGRPVLKSLSKREIEGYFDR